MSLRRGEQARDVADGACTQATLQAVRRGAVGADGTLTRRHNGVRADAARDRPVVRLTGRGRQPGAFAVAEDVPVGAQLARSGLLVADAAVRRAADTPVVHRKASIDQHADTAGGDHAVAVGRATADTAEEDAPRQTLEHPTALFSTSRIVVGCCRALREDLHTRQGREEDCPGHIDGEQELRHVEPDEAPLAASVGCVTAGSTAKSSSFPATPETSLVCSPRTTVSASNSPTSTCMLLNSAAHGTADAEAHGQL